MNQTTENDAIIASERLKNIPIELISIAQWLLWIHEQPTPKHPKGAKVPYQINGQRADVKKPSTWTTFERARDAYLTSLGTNRPYSGMGFVLTADCGIVGVDIDHCINAATGELTEQARRTVDELDTYTEISPSGTGLRLFVFGKKPEGGCRVGPLEIYGKDRYLTVTGNVFGEPKRIEERIEALAIIHQREIVEKRAAGAASKEQPPHKHPVPLLLPSPSVETVAKDSRSQGPSADFVASHGQPQSAVPSKPAEQHAQVLGGGGVD